MHHGRMTAKIIQEHLVDGRHELREQEERGR